MGVREHLTRAVNIALVERWLAVLATRMGLNVWEVLDAAFTKPFGIMPFYPGPGVGGHCIPLDPHYLEWKAHEYNFNTRFIALAGEINNNMPYFCRSVISQALDHGAQKSLKGSKILLVGVAYKADIDDVRESPAEKVLKLLRNAGADVSYHRPLRARVRRPAFGAAESEGLRLRRHRDGALGHRLRPPARRRRARRRRPAQRDRRERCSDKVFKL